MNKAYKFEMKGTARNDQTWMTSGYLICEFPAMFDAAMRASFEQLTEGKAVFGRPEVGCQGPYDITSVLIERVKQ